jgi:hypothetical protein
VQETNGLTECEPKGTDRTEESVSEINAELSRKRSEEVNAAESSQPRPLQWSTYGT